MVDSVRQEFLSRKISMSSSGSDSDDDSEAELERPTTGDTQHSGFLRGRLDGFVTNNTPSKQYCTGN
jgi:hypothetical protein